MNFAALPANLARIRDEIARVQAAEGISGAVTVVGVTKGHPRSALEAAARAGLSDIGENRVQEALGKQEGAPLPVRWHMIGHLQTNKAKFLPGRFWMVHSLDSIRIAGALANALARSSERMRVLVEVNLAQESQKSGCLPEQAEEIVHQVAELESLDLQGLMTMAPYTDDERLQRKVFRGLRELRGTLATQDMPLPELSMGMSGDFAAAVAEGATIVRVGTVLFGERPR